MSFWVTILEAWVPQLEIFHQMLRGCSHDKIALARVSYQDDVLILYYVYMMMGHFIYGYLNVHYMLIKYMCESNRKHYASATHSSQLADRFDTETGGHFTFTWCHCEIFYLTPVQQPEWTHFRVTRNGMAFCDGIIYTNVEPWKGTRVNSGQRENRPGVM